MYSFASGLSQYYMVFCVNRAYGFERSDDGNTIVYDAIQIVSCLPAAAPMLYKDGDATKVPNPDSMKMFQQGQMEHLQMMLNGEAVTEEARMSGVEAAKAMRTST